MKNRRLNVLFIAVIALAAAPQALQDARQWANAAQERAETEFWSLFLSYQTPDSDGARAKGSSELFAMRRPDTASRCPLRRIALPAIDETRRSEGAKDSTPAKAAKETRRVSAANRGAAATTTISQQVRRDFDGEALASAERARMFEFSEEEKEALRGAALHARQTEKITGLASKTDIASSVPRYENFQIRVKKTMELDKLLRQKALDKRERRETNDEIPTPGPIGSM